MEVVVFLRLLYYSKCCIMLRTRELSHWRRWHIRRSDNLPMKPERATFFKTAFRREQNNFTTKIRVNK